MNLSDLKKIITLVSRAAQEIGAQKPGQAVLELKKLLSDAQARQALMQMAASNPQIGEVIQAVDKFDPEIAKNGAKLNYIHTLRCGGKPKKKACGGSIKKPAKAKAGCKCKIARFGNRLVNIDCNGAIVLKKK